MAEHAKATGTRRARLARRRRTLGLTQEDLAGLLVVERTTVARWERGDTEPLPWIRPRLANALQVSADELEDLLAGGTLADRPRRAGAGRGAAATEVPRQLPTAVASFTGRAAESAALTRILDDAGSGVPETLAISAIVGTAGVGKTALALQWAHQAADRFPDGQLYANMRGYDPDEPMPAADVLAGFLHALGVSGQDIPLEEVDRAAMYRSLLAGKKLLIVLDNARSVEQVLPLLPGSPGCAVVVTSRDSLCGLVARHGAARLELDLLPPVEAVGLLGALIGRRVRDDRGVAGTLATQCCRLPLALRLAAELAAARPHAPLAGLVAELSDQRSRLDLLEAGGDPRTAVRAVLSWSYRHLSPDAARAFRLAGLSPGADFDAYAVAALAGTGLGQARTVLDALARAHLIQPAGPGRYRMHDLLRAYARDIADAMNGDEEQCAALTRLFDHYLYAASIAMDALYPAERDRRPRIAPPGTPVPPITSSAAAREWLDAERATLVTATGHAARHGWTAHATRLSTALARHLDNCGHYAEALTIHSHARAAARRAGDQVAEATALNYLGAVHIRQSRYQEALDHHQQALVLLHAAGDRGAQARALNNLGIIDHYQGRCRQATDLMLRAVAIFRETGDQAGEACALTSLGLSEERQGRYDLAARYHREALAIAAATGGSEAKCGSLVSLGTIGVRQRRYQQASGHLHRARAISRVASYKAGEADTLTRIGDLCLREGHREDAARYLREAITLYRELGSRSGEADALNTLGAVRLASGQLDHASTEYAAALGLAARVGDPYQQARAHHGLGEAGRVGGHPGQARRHWQRALALFAELGTPEADQVRAQLATPCDACRSETGPEQARAEMTASASPPPSSICQQASAW